MGWRALRDRARGYRPNHFVNRHSILLVNCVSGWSARAALCGLDALVQMYGEPLEPVALVPEQRKEVAGFESQSYSPRARAGEWTRGQGRARWEEGGEAGC